MVKLIKTKLSFTNLDIIIIIIIIIIMVIIIIIINITIVVVVITIIIIMMMMMMLTHSKTILENTVEIEPEPAALDFKTFLNILAVPSKTVF